MADATEDLGADFCFSFILYGGIVRGFVPNMRQANSTFEILSPDPNATDTNRSTVGQIEHRLEHMAITGTWDNGNLSQAKLGLRIRANSGRAQWLGDDMQQESFFFLFTRYDPLKKTIETSSPELRSMLPGGGPAPTAYEPDGRPCFYILSGVVRILISIRIASRRIRIKSVAGWTAASTVCVRVF